MEIVSIEKKTFEAMVAKFDRFVSRMDAICRRQKRRRAGRSDVGHPRRAHRRAAGGGPGENGPLHR